MTERVYRRALTIAGSDSGGGAGIQADLKTFAALGCYGASVVTALTAQNTRGVQAVHEVPPSFVAAQIDSVLSDIGVDAVKIGMLASAPVIEAVARALEPRHHGPIVLDPVMVAKGGAKLLADDAIDALKRLLLPRATIITPNLPEAEALLGWRIESRPAMEDAARAIIALGARAVVVKGGHLDALTSDDCLLLAGSDAPIWLAGRRIATRNTHGTGCTFSAAIAARLAQGASLPDAVADAKAYLARALAAGADYRIGDGHGPVHHMVDVWP